MRLHRSMAALRTARADEDMAKVWILSEESKHFRLFLQKIGRTNARC